MRRLLPLPFLLCACAGAAPPAPAPPAPPPTPAAPLASTAPAPTTPRYLATFDDLLKRIERDHDFSPRFARDVGHPWQNDVPALREEFARATDRAGALVALRHLQNSLRDLHCYLDPPADLPRRRLILGVDLWHGGTAAAPEARVSRVLDPDAKGALAVGDAVVSVDGLPLAAWLAAHPFETPFLAPDRFLASTLSYIEAADRPWSPVKEGDARVLGVVHEGVKRDVTLHFRRHFDEADEGPDLDHPPPMAKVACDAGSPVEYGDYALTAMGVNVCVYQPKRPTHPRVAVVRYLSFGYGGRDQAQSLRMVRVDHDVLAQALRGDDGVVIDLHDNHGGNNPFIFTGWFTGGPWSHEHVITKVVPGLDAATIAEVLYGEDELPQYQAAQAAGKPSILTRFLCAAGKCDDVRPDASERVTKAPVALITGPGCVSSCDTFALTWATFRLGPIVGLQPAHAYTANRLPVHVSGPESEDLGTLRLALSHSEMREGTSIEGEPVALDWEAPRTFETRKSWVRQAVEEARKRLVKR